MAVMITLNPVAFDEIDIWQTESGVKLCFEAQSGDKCFLELDDQLLGYVIEQLVYYGWNITFEEIFTSGNSGKKKEPSLDTDDLPDITF